VYPIFFPVTCPDRDLQAYEGLHRHGARPDEYELQAQIPSGRLAAWVFNWITTRSDDMMASGGNKQTPYDP